MADIGMFVSLNSTVTAHDKFKQHTVKECVAHGSSPRQNDAKNEDLIVAVPSIEHTLEFNNQVVTLQSQSADLLSKSTTNAVSSLSSTSSSAPSISSGDTSSGSKRKSDKTDEHIERPQKKKRIPRDKNETTSSPRFACFYNKYDPMTYRSNFQTGKKFEICETHDFQNMNKLFEHMKRVHSGQPVQCPRCTRTDFRTPVELLAHQTTPEACIWVPLSQAKRIKWISDDQRLSLQSEISKELRGRSDEEKWNYAFKKLFPDVSPDDIPSPFVRDPIITIVSFFLNGFETSLRQLMSQSSNLEDLAGRIPAIRQQFMAQYGIRSPSSVAKSPSLSDARTLPDEVRLQISTALSPSDVVDPRRLSFESQDPGEQVVPRPACESTPSHRHDSISKASQVSSSRPRSRGPNSFYQATSACDSHTDATNSDTAANSHSPIAPVQWPDQLSAGTLAHGHRDLSTVDLIPRGTLWGLDQDTSQDLGTTKYVLDDFLTDDLSWIV